MPKPCKPRRRTPWSGTQLAVIHGICGGLGTTPPSREETFRLMKQQAARARAAQRAAKGTRPPKGRRPGKEA